MSAPHASPKPGVLMMVHRMDALGAMNHVLYLSNALHQLGWRVGLVARHDRVGSAPAQRLLESCDAEVMRVEFPAHGLNWLNLRRARKTPRAMADHVERFRPDVLHCHSATLVPWAHLAARRARAAVVTTFNIQQIGPNKRRLAAIARRLFQAPFGQQVIAISDEMQGLLTRELGIDPRRVRTPPHSVDHTVFAPPTPDQRDAARQHFGLNPSQFAIGMVALLGPRKNHQQLIRAVAQVRSQGIDAVAICAGKGPDDYKHQMTDLARQLGVGDAVRFVGFQPARQVWQAADAGVLPSREEGFGLVVVEAMLCGVPMIRTPSAGAQSQIDHGRTGFIVPVDDHVTLAEHLIQLAKDPAERQHIAEAGRRHALEHFSLDRMGLATQAIYQDAIDLRRRRKTLDQIRGPA